MSLYVEVCTAAAANHGVVATQHLKAMGVSRQQVSRWVAAGLLVRLGTSSFAVAGSLPSWRRRCAAGLADLGGHGVLAGRAAARLHGLDGFAAAGPEFLVHRSHRDRRTFGAVVSTHRPPGRDAVCRVDGLLTLTAEALILTSGLFGFAQREIENAVDSAIRLRLVSEPRLRSRALAQATDGGRGARRLAEALVDSGGESRLERMFLALLRTAGIARPAMQRIVRDGARTVARVDFLFGEHLVVEVAGHGTHATRRQRQVDAQRHTEMTVRGLRVLTFTYDDVRDRPGWVLAQLRRALLMSAA
jgi:very-short-patch-repair endonuclease